MSNFKNQLYDIEIFDRWKLLMFTHFMSFIMMKYHKNISVSGHLDIQAKSLVP